MTEQEIREIINNNIRTNGREEITGAVANNVLQAIVDYASENITPTFDVSGVIAVGQVTTAVNGDKIARYIPNKAISKWDSAFAGAVGGYSIGNIVIHNDEFYVSEVNNNTTTPSPSSSSWRKLDSGGYTLPTASTTVLGGVKVDGSTIVINSNGVISATGGGGGGGYVLPEATTTTLGGVKIDGSTITKNANGQLQAVTNAIKSERIALSGLNTNLIIGDVNGFIPTKQLKIKSFAVTAYPVPTGSNISVAIKKNGTKITTTNAVIPAGSNNSLGSTAPVFSSDTFNAGDRLNFSIEAIGSVNTGQNLIATIEYEYL